MKKQHSLIVGRFGIELIFAGFSFFMMIIATLTEGLSFNRWLWATAFVVGGFFKAIEGFTKTIKEKALNVEFLMIAAALAAFLTDDFPEGAVLIFIFAVSGVLEEYATSQTEKTLTSLLKLAPKTAILIRNEQEVVISSSELNITE